MYEVSTETLFPGAARTPCSARHSSRWLRFMRGRAARGAGTQLLELACGTGRFASFIKARRRKSAAP